MVFSVCETLCLIRISQVFRRLCVLSACVRYLCVFWGLIIIEMSFCRFLNAKEYRIERFMREVFDTKSCTYVTTFDRTVTDEVLKDIFKVG
jgi:hypothetical protein